MVKAVAAGVPSLAPFFDESSGLGTDAQVRSRPVRGGLRQGDTPGLYGGSKQPTVCDVARLEQFLADPSNERKAGAWARALDITTDGIPDYLEQLTPVLLRHDTLVKNHDYKRGKAIPYHSLLQAGIAILVDQRGLPAVKCSCGNPLRPFEGDTSRISVEFGDGNKKWRGYDDSSVVAVRPASRTLARLALVDVEEPARGISRPVGTTGEDDSTFDTRRRRAVPELAGTTFGHASRRLADTGLAAGYAGTGLPPDGARVTATDPRAGTELRFGEYVTLSVAGDGSGAPPPGDTSGDTSSGSSGDSSGDTSGGTTAPPASGSSGSSTPAPPPSGSGPGTVPSAPSSGTSSAPSSSASSGTPPGPEPPVSSPPPDTGPSSGPAPGSGPASPPSDAPPDSAPADGPPPEVTSAPPEVTGTPQPDDPVTSSAPPPPPPSEPVTSDPVTGDPVTSEPASSAPATSGPVSGEPAVGAQT
ncbi:PASTA domain-containing protein [Streptomyces sp. ALI-76-A]|uniref:PASTA domain-containing protein n=1 Tax=Streptomyces sp. ALI-76-A TaxID=3025736 RepID=UPI0033652950